MARPESFSSTERFWNLLKPDSIEIRNVYVYSLFSGIVSLSLPLGIQAIVNLIQGGRISTSWIVLVSFVVLGVTATGVIQILQMRITENLQQKVFTRAALEFAYRVPRIKMEALYQHYAPELMNRFFDVMSVQKGLSKMLIDFTTAALHVFFGLLLLSFYHNFFVFFSLILLLLVYAIFVLTFKKGLQTSLVESKHKYKVVHWLEELARTNITFKLAGSTDLPLTRTNKHVSEYLKARESHFKVLMNQYGLMVLFKFIVAAGLLVIGGMLVLEQRMNIGQFIAAEIIILLVMSAVEKLVVSLETIYDVLTALEKIGQVTDLELEEDDGIDLVEQSGENGLSVAIENVDFNYPGLNDKTLNSLSLKIKSGEKIVVEGPNGSGKSTLLYILAGLYNVQRGSISYNNLPKGNLNTDSLRSVIGDCLASEQLFGGTILENITVGRKKATFEQVQLVVKELGLEDFIRSQPEGYNSYIDPQGQKLPNSILRKLLLARSVVDEPKLLVLQDALEQINVTEREKVIDFLMSDKNKWTLVAVSSNPYFIQKADRVLWMENGRVRKSI